MLFNYSFNILLVSASLLKVPSPQPVNAPASIPDTPSSASLPIQTLWFDQPIDHDDVKVGSYQQKYFVNTDFYKPGGPAILFVGGKDTLNTYWLSNGLAVEIAKENNGILFGLEHRYYGESQPYPTLTLDNLKYLSSLNGVKDAGNFMKNVINPLTNETLENTRWITVGGSYPGALSAWIRQEFPDLVYAAVASSATVLAKEDFFEYDQVVSKALGNQCFKHVEQVKNYIDDEFSKNDSRPKLKKAFGCSDVCDDTLFLYTIYDLFADIIQYNSPTASPNINSLCQGFSKLTKVEEKYKYFASQLKLHLSNRRQTCYDFTNLDSLTSLDSSNGNWRQWNYQLCTEYGYWQTAPKGASTRSKHLTVNWFNEFYCSEAIYGKRIGPPNTNVINGLFKALNNNTPRTIWVNGGADPWRDLSVQNIAQSTSDRPIYIIEKGSHAQDLGVDRPTDSDSLRETRQSIRADIVRWLKP